MADFFDTGMQNLFTGASASIPAGTTLRSSWSLYVLFVCNTIFFALLVLSRAHRKFHLMLLVY
jgi:hypothetical protein